MERNSKSKPSGSGHSSALTLDLMQNLPAVLSGGDLRGALSKKWNSLHSELRAHIRVVSEQLIAIAAVFAGLSPDPKPIADQTISKLNAKSVSGAQGLSVAHDELLAAKKFNLAFVMMHGLARRPRHPDKLFSAALLLLLAVFEGVLTATFFLSGGFVPGFAQALGLGLSISGINIVVAGLIGGGVFGRYWNYGLNTPEADPAMIRKRCAGRIGAVLTALALVGLLVASGILRATGEPEHLGFTLENLGAAADNFHSLMLWALGLSFSILAWIKGLGAFSDPYPGFGEASKAASDAEQKIHDVYRQTCREIEDVCETALEELEDMSEDVRDQREDLAGNLSAVRRERDAARAAIANVPAEFAAYEDAQRATLQMLGDGSSQNTSAPQDIAEALALLERELPEIPEDLESFAIGFEAQRTDAETRIATAKVEAMQTLNEAYRLALSLKS